jgi:hypothetical protein
MRVIGASFIPYVLPLKKEQNDEAGDTEKETFGTLISLLAHLCNNSVLQQAFYMTLGI